MQQLKIPVYKTPADLSEYLSKVQGVISYADSLLVNPLDLSEKKRLQELLDFSRLLTDTEQDITKLLEENHELNFSQFNTLKWNLKGRKDLIDEEYIRIVNRR